VMSGSFVQRGEPAVLSKFDRAADMARAGYDLVLELPVRFALSSAQRFAEGGVSALAQTGIVDTLFFGSECGDMQLLQKAAAATEDAAVAAAIKAYTEQGQSYPAAQQKAVNEAYGETAASVFGGANNILAAEYLKANSRLQTGLAAQTMLRAPAAPSAHGIRRDAAAGLPLGGRVRAHTAKLLAGGGAIDQDLWQRVAMYKLRELPADAFANGDFNMGMLAESGYDEPNEGAEELLLYQRPLREQAGIVTNDMISLLINHLLGWVSATQMATGELYTFDDTYIDATEVRDAVAQRMIGKIEADDFNTLLWYVATTIADAEGEFQRVVSEILAEMGVTRAQMRRFTDNLMTREYLDPAVDWVQPSYYIIEKNDGSLCTYDDVSYFFKKLKKCITYVWENPTKNTLGMDVSYDDFGAMVGFDADLKQFSTVVPYEGVFNYSVKTDDFWQTQHTAHGELQWWNDRYITGDMTVKLGEDVDGVNESFVRGNLDVLNQKDGQSLGVGADANMRYQTAVRDDGAESEKFEGSAVLSLRENGMGSGVLGASVSGETVQDDHGFATYATAMVEVPGAAALVVDMAIEPSVYEEIPFAGGQAVDLSQLDEAKTELIKNEVMAQAAKIGLSLITNPSVMSDLMTLVGE